MTEQSNDPRLPQAGYTPSRRSNFAMPVYQDEAPSPRPSSGGQTPARTSPLAHLDTGLLNRMQRDLRSNIPGDPTFMAHMGALLRAIVGHELSNPARLAADQEAASLVAQAAAEKAQADLAARHEAEKAAVHPDDERQQHELAVKHEQELAAQAHRQAADELVVKQAAEAKEFATLQQKQRDALAAEFNPQIAPAQ